MRKAKYLVFAILCCLFFRAIQAAATGDPLEIQIEPEAGDNFSYAVFQCWPPPDGLKPSGVLCVIVHPRETRAAILEQPEPWRKLAGEYHCALMAFSFVATGEADRSWGKARLGSGRAMLRALGVFSEMTSLPEITSVPVVLAGVCEGGQYAYEFAGEHPEKTLGFVSIGGGKHDLALAHFATAIPALFVATPDRGEEAVKNITTLFRCGKDAAAPWRFSVGSMASYDASRNNGVAATFLRETMRRLTNRSRTCQFTSSDGNISSSKTNAVEGFGARMSSPAGLMEQTPRDSASAQHPDDATEREPEVTGESLPFPSSAIHEAATIQSYPGRINAKRYDDPEAARRFFFDVSASEGSAIDSVQVLNTPHIQCMNIEKISSVHWHASGAVDLTALPAGNFKIELPVRWFNGKKQIFGGATVPISGAVFGDVVVKATAINFGAVEAGQIASARINLRSSSNTPIELEGVSGIGRNISVENPVASSSRLSLQVHLAIDASAASGDALSGYLYLQTKSNEERKIKIFYYGSVARPGQNPSEASEDPGPQGRKN